MPRCRGITKAGTPCKRRYRTADRGLMRGSWYCDQHGDQRAPWHVSDLDLARAMLNERPQCAIDYEADDTFAAYISLSGLEHQEYAHRRRVQALGALVKLGEAEAWWTGIRMDATWHGARRARMYALKAKPGA